MDVRFLDDDMNYVSEQVRLVEEVLSQPASTARVEVVADKRTTPLRAGRRLRKPKRKESNDGK